MPPVYFRANRDPLCPGVEIHMSVSVRWLDHTAIAVHSIEAALPLYRDILGGDPQELSHNPDKGFSVLTLRYPHGGGIELIQPLGPSGFVHDFLARRGEGVHHITFLVDDLRAAVAEARTAEAFASFMTYMEILYRVWRRLGEKSGKAAYLRLKALPIRRVDVSEELLLLAARIKATHDLSLPDAWIAATAVAVGGRLVHKDPEFRPLAGDLPVLELPLKTQATRRKR